MAKTTPAVPVVPVPGKNVAPPLGSPFTVYAEGIDIYGKTRINGDIDLALDDGTTRRATVQGLQVAPLIDLIGNFGQQNVYTYGGIYSPLTLVQALTDASPADVLDVTKLYTALIVTLPMPSPAPLPAT